MKIVRSVRPAIIAVAGVAALWGAMSAWAEWSASSEATRFQKTPQSGDINSHIGWLDDYVDDTFERIHVGIYNSFCSGHDFGPAPNSHAADEVDNTIGITWSSTSEDDSLFYVEWSSKAKADWDLTSMVTNGATWTSTHTARPKMMKATMYGTEGPIALSSNDGDLGAEMIDPVTGDPTTHSLSGNDHKAGSSPWAILTGAGGLGAVLLIPGQAPAFEVFQWTWCATDWTGTHPPATTPPVYDCFACYGEQKLEVWLFANSRD